MELTKEEYLEHFGTAGMKWGIRRGKSTTGNSRLKGLVLDRNQRNTQKQIRRQAGTGTIRDRVAQTSLKIVLGQQHVNKYRDVRLSALKQQKARIESGHTHVLDKLQTFGAFYAKPSTAGNLIISRTSGHSGKLYNRFGAPESKKTSSSTGS